MHLILIHLYLARGPTTYLSQHLFKYIITQKETVQYSQGPSFKISLQMTISVHWERLYKCGLRHHGCANFQDAHIGLPSRECPPVHSAARTASVLHLLQPFDKRHSSRERPAHLPVLP